MADLITDLLNPDFEGTVAIIGPPGSGKSTAARHLEECLDDVRVDDDATCLPEGGGRRFYTATHPLDVCHAGILILAPWGRDECVEYLLARHPDSVASVMSRIDDWQFAGGNAELWVAILDALGDDHALPSVRAALRTTGSRLGRHEPVRLLLHADRIIASLKQGTVPLELRPRVGRIMLEEVAREIDDDCRVTLEGETSREAESAVASILARVDVDWRPRALAILRSAYLSEVAWPGVDLRGADLRGADLRRANLSGAQLAEANLSAALLSGARLDGAELSRVRGDNADLRGASFVAVNARNALLRRVDIRRARLDSSILRHLDLRDAHMEEASLLDVDLTGAWLDRAYIDGADFGGANLTGARLRWTRLDLANFSGTRFSSADLTESRLDGMDLAAAQFDHAVLRGASLTGTSMRGADFRDADLSYALAGYVDWEDADLRGADLRYVNFHMGSSRSGLVDSPIASEGSRTGFYTDEYEERDFKSPEEIRKANLRGADLRGARVDECDFYLVDLREARYSTVLARFFKRCGAIL